MDESALTLLGRGTELDRIRGLVASARNGRGGALLVRGEPGIGKTALLDAAADGASGVRVIRSDGYEAESAMPYAALQRLGAPFVSSLGVLPQRQAAALRIAAGRDDGDPPDRYLVGLAVLSLLAAAGEDAPILWIVDDAHLVDAESLEVLAFVARRVKAESFGLLLSARPDARTDLVTAGVPVLDLAGLDPLAAVQLLGRSIRGSIDPLLATRIAEETGGNPLALTDLAEVFTATELTETVIAATPVPIGERLERHYAEQLAALPASTRSWLLVAAAETSGRLDLVVASARRLGLPEDAASPAETAGFVVVGRTVSFRHALVRSAAYNAMPASERRRVHEVLATAADEHGRTDLAVWHAAAATVGEDEAVAARLERVADAAAGRGGTSSRAQLLARAAELTPAGDLRSERRITAAVAATSAGAAGLALELLARVDEDEVGAVGRGRILRLRSKLALFTGEREGILSGPADLLEAARLFHGLAPELEQRALLDAFNAELTTEAAGSRAGLQELGRRCRAGADAAPGIRSTVLRAFASHVLDAYDVAVPQLRAALAALRDADDAVLHELGFVIVPICMGLWDDAACAELLERTARAARDAGALQALDTIYWLRSVTELVTGDPAASGRYIQQVRELRRAMGYDAEQVVNPSYLAWTGAPVEVVEQIAQGVLDAGWAGVQTIAITSLCARAIAEGRYREAFDRLDPLVARDYIQVSYQQVPDLIEAAVRSGLADRVGAAAERLSEFAAGSGTPWVRGLEARSLALLAADEDAEAHYLAAIDHLTASSSPGDLGRAHLIYGEWLRRMRRRREAREQLRHALAVFTRVDSPAFADRARRELEATGEHVVHGEPGEIDPLTPQESTVAALAAEGRTNAEIGAMLFISANTVDYHLRKVFRKLGVTSRRQLAERFG
ncbi:AAA family ATPase [Agromyces sp. MMS24-JH15]|uniref:helix-turn-helix transcriptional regulator n=1 Tax=Agromyces sp. MMS24-JH15 TaxID=3243765 RepID=UPI0037481AAA